MYKQFKVIKPSLYYSIYIRYVINKFFAPFKHKMTGKVPITMRVNVLLIF